MSESVEHDQPGAGVVWHDENVEALAAVLDPPKRRGWKKPRKPEQTEDVQRLITAAGHVSALKEQIAELIAPLVEDLEQAEGRVDELVACLHDEHGIQVRHVMLLAEQSRPASTYAALARGRQQALM